MPKAKKLIDDLLAQQPKKRTGIKSWNHKLAENDPEKMEEINSAIDAHNAGDPKLLRIYPSKRSLAMELVKHVPYVTDEKAIVDYMDKRKNGTA